MKALFPRGFRYSSAFLRRSNLGQQVPQRSFATAESSKQQPPLKANTETSQSKSTTEGGQKSGSGGSTSSSGGGGGGGRGGLYFTIFAAGGAAAAYYYADDLGLSKYIEDLMGKPAPADDMNQKKSQQKAAASAKEQTSKPAPPAQEKKPKEEKDSTATRKSATGTVSQRSKQDIEQEKQSLNAALSLAEKAIEKEKSKQKDQQKSASTIQGSSSTSGKTEEQSQREQEKNASQQQTPSQTVDQEGGEHSTTEGGSHGQPQEKGSATGSSESSSKSSSGTSKSDYTTERIAEELREDLIARTRKNVENMSESELRERVLLLTEELSERSKWEAIRINEFLRAQEDKWHQRFAEFAEEQRQALAAEIEDEKSRVSKQLEQQNNEWRNSELQRMSHEVEQIAQSQLGKLLQQVKDHDAKVTQDRLRTLEHLRGKMEGLSEGLEEYHHYNVLSNNVHRIATSSLYLLQAFEYEKKQPLTDEIAAIEVAGKRDDAISLAVKMMPSCVHSPKGPPTRQELFTRLRRVLRAGEAAALTPQNSGLVGHAVGSVTSGLLYKEEEDVPSFGPSLPSDGLLSPYVEAARGKLGAVLNRAWDSTKDAASQLVPTSTESESASNKNVSKQQEWSRIIEEATEALHGNDLSGAVRALDKLEGYPAVVVRDWKKEARERLRIEHSMRIIRAETTCLTVSMY
eukprot:gb/GECG01003791.1/.p1 GENE.gb/GECG01003791.1/~~gb/GECG01003791.1/.p1  ORF type:complete len:687 (+),score=144.98 gb/GECG01003791.1/:1-2061(+)